MWSKLEFPIHRETDATSQMIESLFQVGEGLLEMHKIAEYGTLYAKNCHHDNIITRAAKVINQECFYGRSAAFQVHCHCHSLSELLIKIFFSTLTP